MTNSTSLVKKTVRNRVLLFFFLLVLCLSSTAYNGVFFESADDCYFITSSKQNFLDSAKHCHTLGGRLAPLTDDLFHNVREILGGDDEKAPFFGEHFTL